MDTWVLRLGHRPARDERLSTHLCLVARAFGAQGVMITTEDGTLAERVDGITQRFGGPFQVRSGVKPARELSQWPGKVIHLTMYGQSLGAVTPTLRRWVRASEPLLVVVGATKVPPYVYERADLNLAVGHQPHSEVAALALVLDRLHPNWEALEPVGPTTVTDAKAGKCVGWVPDPAGCLELLEREEAPPWVAPHGQAVATLALAIAQRIPGVRWGLVEAGALLHDWGRAKSQGIDHGYQGGLLARHAGLSPALEHIITTHIGAGLTRREARRMGLPEGNYLPRTMEAKIVAAADNLHSGTRRRSLATAVEQLVSKGHLDSAHRVERLHNSLTRRAGKKIESL